MSEVPFFFPSDRLELFGMFHEPAGVPRDTAFCFCSPFAEEKLWTQLVYVNFARELAGRGYPVLRFDYRGTGDSDGDFEDGSVDAYVVDIRSALAVLAERSGCASMGLLGLRFGATLAAVAAEEAVAVHRLVLWSPIVDGAAYMQDLLRVNLAMQMAMFKAVRQGREALVRGMERGESVNVDGYEITEAMYRQASAIRLVGGVVRFGQPCFIAATSPGDPAAAPPVIAGLRDRFPDAEVVTSMEEPFWKEIRPFYARAENLFGDTLAWLKRHDDDH